MTSNHQEKNRRSREERRHGGCAKGRGQTPAQQERRSGRKGPQACKASSVRFPARRLAVERRDWLQRQDLNLRHRGYERRGMTASLRCGKNGALSFCGLRNAPGNPRTITNSNIRFIDLGDFKTSKGDYDGPVPIRNSPLNPLVDSILGERLRAKPAGVSDSPRAASLADNLCHSECCSIAHAYITNGFKIQFQDMRNPKRKITPAL